MSQRAFHEVPENERHLDKDDDDDLPKNLSAITPAYRRALWIVVLLNVGYGLVEIVASSQALKADALDFLGDGLITFLGLLAIKWSLTWRAMSALIQGVFLAALGIGVLGTTVYRVFVLNEPEAGMMGIFGGIALAVNVAAALVLRPHRGGDANMRAVWLFSRNDAIGNFAVVVSHPATVTPAGNNQSPHRRSNGEAAGAAGRTGS